MIQSVTFTPFPLTYLHVNRRTQNFTSPFASESLRISRPVHHAESSDLSRFDDGHMRREDDRIIITYSSRPFCNQRPESYVFCCCTTHTQFNSTRTNFLKKKTTNLLFHFFFFFSSSYEMFVKKGRRRRLYSSGIFFHIRRHTPNKNCQPTGGFFLSFLP